MKSVQRELAVMLRKDKLLGYASIARQVGVSKGTLSRWLQDMPLSEQRILELRRANWSKGEAKRERFRNTMRKKRERRERDIYEAQKKLIATFDSRELYIAGLMLYAGEGDKKTRAEIAFSNSDWVMVRFFANWLHEYLNIPKNKLRIQLHLYSNMNIHEEEQFWLRQLSMKSGQLCKSQVRLVKEGGYSYGESVRHGTCKLYVGGVIKKSELMLSIRAFFDRYGRRLRA